MLRRTTTFAQNNNKKQQKKNNRRNINIKQKEQKWNERFTFGYNLGLLRFWVRFGLVLFFITIFFLFGLQTRVFIANIL